MATVILRPTPPFPAGTSVGAYLASAQLVNRGQAAVAPLGTVVETQTVAADGTLTFSALAENTKYVAYASVSGAHRYVLFASPGPGAYSGPITVIDGRKEVATTGTRVQLVPASTPYRRVVVTAETDNTGVVVVGGATVVAAVLTRRGTALSAGQSVTFDGDDLADIYVDAMINTDGVTFTALTGG